MTAPEYKDGERRSERCSRCGLHIGYGHFTARIEDGAAVFTHDVEDEEPNTTKGES